MPFVAYAKKMGHGGPIENEDTFAVIGGICSSKNFGVAMPDGTIGKSILNKLV